MKAEAVRERLEVFAGQGPSDVLRALLLAFGFSNVSVEGTGQNMYGIRQKIGATLIDPDGKPRPCTDEQVCALATEVIGRAVIFPAPDVWNNSGASADWLATLIGTAMPRCDTADVLKGIRGDALVAAANAAGIDARGQISAVRKRLVGKLPGYAPVGFDATGPDPSWANDNETTYDDTETEGEDDTDEAANA
jgi:hypothetical protein